MNLKEIYDSGEDVRDSQIPEKWKSSFEKFMFGQGNIKEFIYFSEDFRRWYFQNEKEILRDINIDIIIN